MQKVFCLFGPTASGKTAAALKLVEKFPFEIISVDSAMVYRGMDIGTAKPSLEEQRIAPHRLIDICDPAENYSAGQFCLDATREIESIFQAGKTPLLVGGTMMYFNLLQRGFAEFPASDAAVRAALDREAEIHGWSSLHKRLQTIDPVTASELHPNDTHRIQRALELHAITGKTVSQLRSEQQWHEHPYQFINLCLWPENRKALHERIVKRFDAMLAAGFIDEVKQLYNRGDLSANLPSMRMVGYRQVWSYLAGEYDYRTMRERGIIATRQFAKRQYTWLRQWKEKHIFNAQSDLTFKKLIEKIRQLL